MREAVVGYEDVRNARLLMRLEPFNALSVEEDFGWSVPAIWVQGDEALVRGLLGVVNIFRGSRVISCFPEDLEHADL